MGRIIPYTMENKKCLNHQPNKNDFSNNVHEDLRNQEPQIHTWNL